MKRILILFVALCSSNAYSECVSENASLDTMYETGADGACIAVDTKGRTLVNVSSPVLPASSSVFFTATSAADITDTVSTAVKTATASTVYYVTTWTVSNLHASVDTRVDLLDGSTVIAQCPAAHAGGGCVVTFPTPLKGTVNTALNCKNATTGAATRCTVVGYTSAS